MRPCLLIRSHTSRGLVESAFNHVWAGTKHGTAAARGHCFGSQTSFDYTLPPRRRNSSFPRARSTSTIAQKHVPNTSSGPSLSTALDNEVVIKAETLLQSPLIPDTAEVEGLLQACEVFANLVSGESQSVPASNLLSLEETPNGANVPGGKEIPLTVSAKNAAAQLISSTAYKVIKDPNIYITPKLLSTYVNVQALLGRPSSLPEVFYLYAYKPVPKPKTIPVKYTIPNPNKPTAHIPLPVADAALTAAIKTKDLSLCFDIIHYSVCARAFWNSKFLRKALVPISGAVLCPFAVYKLAIELSPYLDTMEPTMAFNVLFGGVLSYVGFTATIGYVAVTTANDQMDRVTWVEGTPLYERYMREDERMLIDRVAGAWGFKQRSRRGEEEGPDWEALREWVGMSGMILDRTELMDGMQ
ncbi:MAG: hypothetical protein L6R40_002475 [Gallowayella cf. fulva]|nr:MAG: hypothetical protein L6R40_002475 [Xanthomendoza cf. fulva]